ncbi:MAG: SDR family NAD(P)-dependent oxidoreductase [Caldithrix sp.]|nr:SDR family NAD(P)-dependent oxidoreductase [Caldithrix sp.]
MKGQPMRKQALLIGNSDGIGKAVTQKLLTEGWTVYGISRSDVSLNHPSYQHAAADVREQAYSDTLRDVLAKAGPLDVCIYCAGIGELLDASDLTMDVQVVEVNLMGLIKTVARVLPVMLEKGGGHFIGLSSVADVLLSDEAPAYHASKAGFSNYLEGLALALKNQPVYITNVRFGFVDTKMAKGPVKPFMMSVERATDHLLKCIKTKPARYTVPKIAIPLVAFRRFMLKIKLMFP